MRAISYRQILFLGFMSMPITGHFILVSPLITVARKDAWVSILCALPIGIFLAFMLYRIHILHRGANLQEVLLRVWGNFLGKVGLLLFICNGLYMVILTVYTIVDFASLIYLMDKSSFTITSVIYTVALYGMYAGIEAVARASEPLAMLLPFTGSSAGISTLSFKEYSMLFPVFQNGVQPILSGFYMVLALYGELIVFLFFTIQKKQLLTRRFFYVLSGIILFISITFLGTTTGSLAIFGVESSISKLYPTYDILKLVNFGFINRFDVYGIFTLVTGGVIRIVIWQIALIEAISKLSSAFSRWIYHGLIVIIVLVFIFRYIPSTVFFEEVWIAVYYPMTAWISFGLTVLCWLKSEWMMRKNQILGVKNIER